MPKIKQNGEGFYYMLHYRRNKPGYPEETLKISDWRAERAEISIDHPDEPFQQYSIYIRTGNNRGQSHERLTEPVLGFTGEDGRKKILNNLLFLLRKTHCQNSVLQ